MLSLPRIIGHRGAAALAPENTIAGFRKAAEVGVEWVEFDTRLASDGAVVLHDRTVDRTSTGAGAVRDLSLGAIASLDAGGWFGRDFDGEHLPTLSQALGVLRQLDLGINVELKSDPGLESDLAAIVSAILKEDWEPDADNLLVSSFSVLALRAFHRVAPEVPLGLLVGGLPPDWAEAANELGCFSVHADYRKLTPSDADSVKSAGFSLAVYTVNLLPDAQRMLAIGVDSIITDRPDLLLAGL